MLKRLTITARFENVFMTYVSIRLMLVAVPALGGCAYGFEADERKLMHVLHLPCFA